ncbi:STM4504/CBY_0614 family protein [Zymomonas mobilis]|uniref:STM4504/CBY_0614 family protein n=1 Tax=Zymomonas mobilis TaxID=542 RepID=UPI0021C4AE55|nr:hypothetical protein [Zymomonas mobilis]MCP9308682.1 hypothetical protein [Zymomonas mobilis]
MAIADIYSKRQKRANGEVPDVYTYDEIPQTLKVQIVQIFKEIFNKNNSYQIQMESASYSRCSRILCREYGVFNLVENDFNEDPKYQITISFISKISVEKALDVVETFLRVIIILNGKFSYLDPKAIEDAISEINYRFKEHGVGYRFESGQIIRIDNEIIHSEAVKPALALLHDPVFAGANDEFLKAYDHYRHKRYKETIASCNHSFESTLKIICQLNGWDITPKDGASKLIKKCFDNHLLPQYLDNQFSSVKSVLESGIPTIRNKTSGHGQGSEKTEVPEYLAQYALNLTASAIVFLVNAHKNFVPEEVSNL